MWRFFVAIGTFAVAMVFLVTGLSFKVFAGPHTVSETIKLAKQDGVSYVVVDPSVITAKPGVQTVEASGGDVNFVAYGRTIDVFSWIGDSPYLHVTRDKNSGKIAVETIRASAGENADKQSVVNPLGSDMWLDQTVAQKSSAILQMTLPKSMSVIIAGDGQAAVPTSMAVYWPLPQPTFLWMGDDQLLMVGGIIAVAGIAVYLWALSSHRRQQGPRRKTPRPPKPRKIKHSRHEGISAPRTRGRRAVTRGLGMVALPITLVAALGLSSCSSPYESGFTEPTPTPTSTAPAGVDLPPVSVTPSQLSVILSSVRLSADEADTKLDGKIAEQRFAGPALESRRSNYAIRKADATLGVISTIPTTPVALFLPEATAEWPRQLLTVFQPQQPTNGKAKDDKAETPTVALILQQASPRENYKVLYQVNLQPNQEVPEVAIASTGTVEIPVDSKLLVLPPNQVATAYADILMRGDDSQYAALFNKNMDTLRETIAAERAQQNADNVVVTYADQAGSGAPVAMATVSSGAIVAVTVDEIGSYEPQGGRSLKLTGALKALAGIELSPKPVDATYQYQMLFYVPPLGSEEQIQVLGYTENLVRVAQR